MHRYSAKDADTKHYERHPIDQSREGKTLKPNRFRIIFVPLGSCLGHLSRNDALAREIKRRVPDTETVFVAGGLTYEAAKKWRLNVFEVPEDASQNLLNQWFKTAGKESEGASSRIFFSLFLSFCFNGLLRWVKLRSLVRSFKPDVIVADGEYPVLVFCRIQKIPCVFMTNDLMPAVPTALGDKWVKRIQPSLDRVIAHFLRWGKIIIIPDYPGTTRVPAGLNVTFTGPILKIRAEAVPDREAVRKKMKLEPDERMILVTGSGTGAEPELIHKAIAAFKKARDAEPKAKMIVKYWPSLSDQEASMYRDIPDLKLVRFVPDLFEYMVACDLIVTHSGHTTLMEAALAGVPIITTPYAGQMEQEANARRMEAVGGAVVIRSDELTAGSLASSIISLLRDEKKCLEMASINKRFVEAQGASKAAELVLELLRG